MLISYLLQFQYFIDEPDRLLSTVIESSWKYNDGTAALYNGAMYTAVYEVEFKYYINMFSQILDNPRKSKIGMTSD